MENTLENKAKFFAQYLNQRQSIYREGFILRDNINPNGVDEYDLLELKPLSQITDEDAIEVAKLQDWENDKIPSYRRNPEKFLIRQGKHDLTNLYSLLIETIDYLRSKGYALPWMGLSVEKQIEYGWIKLKS